MMHAASIGLGLRLRLLAEGPDVSAAQVVHDVAVGDYTDPATVAGFAAGCDVVTFDHEHVPTAILHDLVDAGVAVRPGPEALVHAQDKAVMRARLAALGVARAAVSSGIAAGCGCQPQVGAVAQVQHHPAPGQHQPRVARPQPGTPHRA